MSHFFFALNDSDDWLGHVCSDNNSDEVVKIYSPLVQPRALHKAGRSGSKLERAQKGKQALDEIHLSTCPDLGVMRIL